MKIIGNKKTAEFLKQLYNVKRNVQIVQEADVLDTGRRKLKFFFTPMDSLLRLLTTKMIKKHIIGIFGGYGWAGGAVKAMTEFVKENSLELVEPIVEAQFASNTAELEQCRELGRNVAKRVSKSLKP